MSNDEHSTGVLGRAANHSSVKAGNRDKNRTARLPFAQRALFQAIRNLEIGELTIRTRETAHHFCGSTDGGISAEIQVYDPQFFSKVIRGGVVGVAEAYRDGWWNSPDLVSVIRLLVRNRKALESVDGRFSRVAQAIRSVWHRLNRNSIGGSRRNISAHYDLSNDFFELLLDKTMTYSSAIFDQPHSTLEEAQISKIDRLCRKLDLGPNDHLLEIGTGWGAFSIHAAAEYGCRVTTTTISQEQHRLAAERVEEAGLSDRIEMRLEDYRHLKGQFNKVVSVEMIEAVGHEYYRDFFRQCARLATPDALFAMQAITIADQYYDRARRTVDFIKRYIFPGSNIPSMTALLQASQASSDWRLRDLEDLTPHYCRTLAEWRVNLQRHQSEIADLGLDEQFRRLWEFYLVYCEGGFAERHISSVQIVFTRPDWRGGTISPRVIGSYGDQF